MSSIFIYIQIYALTFIVKAEIKLGGDSERQFNPKKRCMDINPYVISQICRCASWVLGSPSVSYTEFDLLSLEMGQWVGMGHLIALVRQ